MMRVTFWSGVLVCVLVGAAFYQGAVQVQTPRTPEPTLSPRKAFPGLAPEANATDQARLAAALPISEASLLSEQAPDPTGGDETIDVFQLSRVKKKRDMESASIAQVQDSQLLPLLPRVVEDVVPPPASKK